MMIYFFSKGSTIEAKSLWPNQISFLSAVKVLELSDTIDS